MLGWFITVHRKTFRRRRPASSTSGCGPRIAAWQGGLDAIDWLEALVPDGSVIDLGGDGYPRRFTARAGAILPTVLGGPPEANERWVAGAHDRFIAEPSDALGTGWLGATTVDRDQAATCTPDEWLVVEVWDES